MEKILIYDSRNELAKKLEIDPRTIKNKIGK
jgi:hypothetical protein